MAAYWSNFASQSLSTAGDFAGDMLPILAVIGGLALGERVVRFILNTARG